MNKHHRSENIKYYTNKSLAKVNLFGMSQMKK